MPTRDEFRSSLINFSERAMRIKSHLKNEEATKVSLVLPFIALLGYDDRDPTEVSAEHSADFSEKYKNRVDYAILKDMQPIIAVECKSVGGARKDDRGQLKSYFNACKSVKLALLTDGIVFEFFVDSFEPNIMDNEPFLTVDFSTISTGVITDTVVDGLLCLHKSVFDPTLISETARMNLIYLSFFEYLTKQFQLPSVEFTRFLLRESDIKHVRAAAMDAYRDIAKTAFQDVFNARVLQRLDINAPPTQKPQPAKAVELPEPTPLEGKQQTVVETTQRELDAFEDVRRRLAFLCSGDFSLFDKIENVGYKDYQGKFVIFYARERKGRLLEIVEGKDGQFRYVIADGGEGKEEADLGALDVRLLNLFKKRIADAGQDRD